MFAESLKQKNMFLRIYELANKLYMQTSTIVDEGKIQITKKNGALVLKKNIVNTNFVQITDTIANGEYMVKLTTNSNEYKRYIKIEIKR